MSKLLHWAHRYEQALKSEAIDLAIEFNLLLQNSIANQPEPDMQRLNELQYEYRELSAGRSLSRPRSIVPPLLAGISVLFLAAGMFV